MSEAQTTKTEAGRAFLRELFLQDPNRSCREAIVRARQYGCGVRFETAAQVKRDVLKSMTIQQLQDLQPESLRNEMLMKKAEAETALMQLDKVRKQSVLRSIRTTLVVVGGFAVAVWALLAATLWLIDFMREL